MPLILKKKMKEIIHDFSQMWNTQKSLLSVCVSLLDHHYEIFHANITETEQNSSTDKMKRIIYMAVLVSIQTFFFIIKLIIGLSNHKLSV